jgi:hypothetical protein
MSSLSRVFLIMLAVAFVAVVFCLGTSFTYGAESGVRAQGSEFFWLLLGIVFASPFWVPAALAPSSAVSSRVVLSRYFCHRVDAQRGLRRGYRSVDIAKSPS